MLAHGVGSWVYTMSDKWKSDSNVTIEVLQRVLTDIEQKKKGLPRKLYLQMDNCVRENKNKYVLGYLSWLVERGVFEEIELSFLPVGHTHEDIDQLFSRLAIALKGRNAVDRTELYSVIRDAYVKWDQPPCCSHLESVANMSAFLEPYLEPIFNHAGRETLHFSIQPHIRGASIRTKPSAVTKNWEHYPNGVTDGKQVLVPDDCGFHLLKLPIPRPPFKAGERPPPSHPKEFVESRFKQIASGLDKLAKDNRMSALQYDALLTDLADFQKRNDVPFAWPRDGAFALEAVDPLMSPRRGRSNWPGISPSDADGYAHAAAALEHDRKEMVGDDDDADVGGPAENHFGPLHNQARHTESLQSLRLAKMFPEKLRVGHFIAVKPFDKKMNKSFYIGQVTNMSLYEDDQWWIDFQWWTAYQAKDGPHRNTLISGVNGCYAADVKDGQPVTSYALFPTDPTACASASVGEDLVLTWFNGDKGFSKTTKKLSAPLLKELETIAASNVIIRQNSDVHPPTDAESNSETEEQRPLRPKTRKQNRKRKDRDQTDEESEQADAESEPDSESESPAHVPPAAKKQRQARGRGQ